MNEEELRGLVREAVERHLGHFSPVAGPARGSASPLAERSSATAKGYENAPVGAFSAEQDPAYVPHGQHASHLILKVVAGSVIDEGACLIEPAVRCNHCGYCQSLGH